MWVSNFFTTSVLQQIKPNVEMNFTNIKITPKLKTIIDYSHKYLSCMEFETSSLGAAAVERRLLKPLSLYFSNLCISLVI